MNRHISLVEGNPTKGGAVRNIKVSMDEKIFLQIRDMAMKDERSFSAMTVRLVQRGLAADPLSHCEPANHLHRRREAK